MAVSYFYKLLSAVALSGTLLAADKQLSVNYNIPLWEEGKVPMANGTGLLDAPFLTGFLPQDGKNNGGSVVVAPGGGNIMLMYVGEGMEIDEPYNVWGGVAVRFACPMAPPYKHK